MSDKELTDVQKQRKQTKEVLEKMEADRKHKQAQLKYMKGETADLELKARYWKAQVDVMKYSMEYASLEGPYKAYLEAEAEKAKKAMEELQNQPDIKVEEVENA